MAEAIKQEFVRFLPKQAGGAAIAVDCVQDLKKGGQEVRRSRKFTS